MSKLDIPSINKSRKNLGIKPIGNVVCGVCKAVNEHFTQECQHAFCNLCTQTGHTQNACPRKPVVCQFCGQDINPNNYENKNPPHTTFFNCPQRIYVLAKFKAFCIKCRKPGHYAYQCYSTFIPKRNYNGKYKNGKNKYKKWNNWKKKKNNK